MVSSAGKLWKNEEPSAPQKVMATSKVELSVGAALDRAAKVEQAAVMKEVFILIECFG